MKKQAQLGQWKTPPNAVYAQQQEPALPTPAQMAQTASLGTKMQLMGLVQKKSMSSSPPVSMAVPISTVAKPNTRDDMFVSMGSMPLASPIDASPFATINGSPNSADGRRTSQKRPVSMTASGSRKDVSSANSSPAAVDRSTGKAAATPEDKEKMLAHSRTMARLRRQQQRVLTDSLEAEFFELCVSAAYLKAVLAATPSNVPLHSTQVDTIYQQATERSLEAMSSNIPSARSQELKAHAVSEKTNMPQAHIVPSLKLDDATNVYLAVTVGSRRESLSFSTERRKGALAWATSGVRNIYSDLNKDALPAMLAANCANDVESERMLAARLKLTPEQKALLQKSSEELRGDVAKVVASQRAAEMIFSESWLSLPKTDAFMEQVRDTATTEQMNKLISWSITNEAQISTLKLGSVPALVSASSSVNGQ